MNKKIREQFSEFKFVVVVMINNVLMATKECGPNGLIEMIPQELVIGKILKNLSKMVLSAKILST